MNTIDDDKIQQLAEKGIPDTALALSPEEEKEIALYTHLFSALKEDPVTSIPPTFSARLVAGLEAKRDRKHNLLLYTLFLSLLIIGALLMSSLIPAGSLSVIVQTFNQSKEICFFTLSIIALIHFADHKLLKSPGLSRQKKLPGHR